MLKLTGLKNGNISNHTLIIYYFSIDMSSVHCSRYFFPRFRVLYDDTKKHALNFF